MAISRKVRDRARRLYIYERRTPEQVAHELRTTRSTIMRWKKQAQADGDDWDKAKAAASLAGDGAAAVAVKFLEDFVFLLEATMAHVKAGRGEMTGQQRVDALAKLADAYGKATLAVRRSMPQVNELAVAMEVLQLQEQWLAEHKPALRRAFAEVLEPFGQALARRYG
jgi:hypothetical protein